MTYFIFDNPSDKEKMKFLLNYPTKKYKQIYPDQQLLRVKDMIQFILIVIEKTNFKDKLIFWYDFMGVLSWWICRFTFRKRNIVILNILLKDKKSKKNKVAKFLYKVPLKNNVLATVTSTEYGKWINNLLGIQRTYPLLHDIYYGDAIELRKKTGDYVFCGGRNGRDWNKLIDIAKNMPTTRFLSVMPKSIYEEIKDVVPENLKVKYDVLENEFKEDIGKATLVTMPLDTEAPAGLIALFQAGSYKKCVITSDTVTTREYISSEKGALCKNLESWIKNIEFLLNNPNEANKRANNFNVFLNENCSKKIYANKLYKIIGE